MASEGKRRVVRGPQDRLGKKPGQKSYVQAGYSDEVDASNEDTLRNLQADNPDIQIPSDQYHDENVMDQVQGPSYKSFKIAPGADKEAPPQIEVEKLNTPPQAATDMFGRAKPTAEATRKAEIQALMDKYTEATNQAGKNREMSALTSVPLALTNPEAARQRTAGYEQSDNAPVSSITGGQKAAQEQLKIGDQTSDLADQDEERNPDSRISQAYREQLQKNGITFSGKPSASDIKKIYPWIKTDKEDDTKRVGIQTTAETADKDRASKEKVAQAERMMKHLIATEGNISRKEIAQIMARANIDREVIESVLNQYSKTGGGFGSGRGGGLKDAAGLTFNNMSFDAGENKYFSHDDTLGPPSKKQQDGMVELNDEFSAYSGSLHDLSAYIKDVREGRIPLDLNSAHSVMSDYTSALERAVKFFGNGVATGTDVQRAKDALGDPDSLRGWLLGGNETKLQTGLKNAETMYKRQAHGFGYDPSSKPNSRSSITGGGGAGTGGSTGSQDFNNKAKAAADAALNRNELPGLDGQAPVPQTPPIPPQPGRVPPNPYTPPKPGMVKPSADQLQIGKVYKTSKGDRVFGGVDEHGSKIWNPVQ